MYPMYIAFPPSVLLLHFSYPFDIPRFGLVNPNVLLFLLFNPIRVDTRNRNNANNNIYVGMPNFLSVHSLTYFFDFTVD